MDLLTGRAPFILFKLKKVLYWGNQDQEMDFTTINNTAEFTANAALDNSTPRFLNIVGEQISARNLADVASDVTGEKFRPLRAGSLRQLERMIKITRRIFPQKNAVYPPWQGMQYMHNMYGGEPKINDINNDRYPDIKWTSIREVLSSYAEKKDVL